MFRPSLKEFEKLAKQGNLVPVYKEILADLDTPVSAFMKISQGPNAFLLESIEGGEKWARYSFLGADPTVLISTKGKTLTIKNNGVEEEKSIDADNPMEEIKTFLEKYKPVPVEGLPRFSGGAVGYISYDMVRFFEDLPDDTVDDLDVPDSFFMINDTLLVFDNIFQTIKIVANAFIEDGASLELVYNETIHKIEVIEAKLRKNVPQTSLPKN
ncbi:MAG: anthranilate synthase component I, partial [Nitrospinales bacterium]